MKLEDYKEYYIQCLDHYLIPTGIFEELFNEMVNWKNESKQLKQENQQLKDRINKAIEYIENHSLYEEEYDYEENMYLSGINDEIAKKDLLEILKGNNNEL